MDLGRLGFFLREVWTNLTRNAMMQLTAIGTVAAAIALLGAFLFAREAGARVGERMLGRIEVSVFLDDRVGDAEALRLRDRAREDRRVRSVRYIPRAQGLREMSARMRGEVDMSLLTTNPLPNAFRVRVDAPGHVRAVAERLERLPGVARVAYAKEVVARVLRLSEVVQTIGLTVVAALGAVAAILISNTIRLTVDARRKEIAIMKLVGATNAYIRAPFIAEGLVSGVVGAAIAVGLLYAAHAELLPRLIGALPFLPLGHVGVDERAIVLELLGAGAGVGAAASWFAVGRYLRV